MKRRDVIAGTAWAAALFGLPPARASGSRPLPPERLYQSDPEAYWARVREEQFLLAGWRAYLNTGTLGIAPRPVVEAVAEYVNRSAALNLEDYPRWGYETLEEVRQELAELLGCRKEELALTHNATEAINTVANGLDLQPGDEVLLTNQEHPSGRCPWLQKQARFGIAVREVNIPLPPASPEQLTDLLISAIGPRTRVLSFSGITSPTGLWFPVRRICEAARARGVITLVDGAHMNGQVPLQLSELGCDFFAGSPHKWMFAPAGCGLLFGREEMLDRLWVNVATGGWDNKKLKAARFMMVGTNNRAIIEGLVAGLRFLKELGPERVYGRIHQLARRVFEQARALPKVELLTPDNDAMFGGLVSIRIPGADVKPVLKLCRERRLWVLGSGERFRVATHIHVRPADIDAFFAALREGLSLPARG
jgi:selenocysteine lyase/cysteine desulfurase